MLVALLAACSAPPEPAVHALAGEAFGSTWSVKYLGDLPDAEARAATEAVLAEIDARLSTWRPDSDLSRARAAQGPVPVSAETAFVVDASLDLAERSGGAFDPTVGPLVDLWGLHGPRRTTLPTEEEIAAAKASVGWDRVRVAWSSDGPTLDAGGTAFDVSAVVPGYAADRVAYALSGLGAGDLMVEVGGEVVVRGNGPTGGPWRLGIDRPVVGNAPGEALGAVLRVGNVAIATSGNYRNVYEIDGVRVVHTLDPRTGRPVENDVAAATVVASDGLQADGWATVLMVLGTDGLALLEEVPGVDALVFVRDGDEFVVRKTAGMEAWLD